MEKNTDDDDDEKIKKKNEFIAARRQNELKIKNPETIPWKKFEEKIQKHENTLDVEQQSSKPHNFIIKKIEETEKPREERVLNREERKKKRENDPALQFKARNAITAADI
jgi:hypothetical protein